MKPIPLEHNKQDSATEIGAAISRESLYGKKTVTECQGETRLEKVIVAPWGEIFPTDAFTDITSDPEGTLLRKPVFRDEAGNPLPTKPASFKESREIKEAQLVDLLTLRATAVYPAKTKLGPGLYKTTFNYRDSITSNPAILIVKKDEAYLIVGEATQSELLGKTETYNFFEEPENDGSENEEMDFAMM